MSDLRVDGEVTAVYENQVTGHRLVTINANSGVVVRSLLKDGAQIVLGERLSLEGSFTGHPAFGRYFIPRAVSVRPPEGLPALVDYLSRALQIDSVAAGKIVAHFGDSVIESLDRDFGRLREIGFPPDRINSLQKYWRAARLASDVERLCERLGLTNTEKSQFRAKLGLSADKLAQRLREDPFLPYALFPSVSFTLADKLRRSLGLPDLAPCRLRAALLRELKRAARSGHTHLPAKTLLQRTRASLQLNDEQAVGLDEALTQLSTEYGIAKRGDTVCLPQLLQAEMDAAIALRKMLDTPRHFDPPGKQLTPALAKKGYRFPEGREEAARFALAAKVSLIDHRGFDAQEQTAEAVFRSAQALKIRTIVTSPFSAIANSLSTRLGTTVPTINGLLHLNAAGHGYYGDGRKLDAQLLIVVCADSLDIELFTTILNSIHPEASLVLIGDEALAAALGPGKPYRDLVRKQRIPVKLLISEPDPSTPHGYIRQVLSGEKALSRIRERGQPVAILPVSDSSHLLSVLERVVKDISPMLPGAPRDSFRVLYPTWKITPAPSEVNSLLKALFNPPSSESDTQGLEGFGPGDPVLLMHAVDDLPFPAGTRMLVESVSIGPRVSVENGNAKYAIEGSVLDALSPAYAVPSYMSSGSLADFVVLFMPSDMPIYLAHQRLLYAASSVTKQMLFIIGDYDLIAEATKRRPPSAHSGFGELFDDFKNATKRRDTHAS